MTTVEERLAILRSLIDELREDLADTPLGFQLDDLMLSVAEVADDLSDAEPSLAR